MLMPPTSLDRPLSVHFLFSPGIEWSRRGVEPSATVTAAVRESAHLAQNASPDELYLLLTELIRGRFVREALQWLRDTGLLVHVLPELDATVAFSQEGGRRHKDVWDHTKTVVWQSVPTPTVRWAALLHDIGKVPTRQMLPNGRVTFHGHAEVGRRMFRRGPAKRIAFPESVGRRVELLILDHLRAGQYETSWTDAAVRRFALEMGDVLDDLLNLSRADVTSRRPGKRKACLRTISELARRIRAIHEQDQRIRPLPTGLGNQLMNALELPPGPHLGQLRAKLETLFESRDIEGGRDAQYYVDVVLSRRLMDEIEIVDPRKVRRAKRNADSE